MQTVILAEEGKTTTTYYDNVGNKVGEKIGANPETIFKYNLVYQLVKIITPEGKETNYEYDPSGYLKKKESPDDKFCFYRYNKYGELRYEFHRESESDNTPGYIIAYRYDKLGRLLSTALRNVSFTGSDFLSNSSFNPDAENNEDKSDNNLTLINIYDDVNEKSNYAGLNSTITQITFCQCFI